MSRGYKERLLRDVIELIVHKSNLPVKYKAHKLSGDFKDCWECRINPDWLLIWRTDEINNVVTFIRTGTHSDLF